VTDSACVRAGYDSTGRYCIPELTEDLCPECRRPPGEPHHEKCRLRQPATIAVNITEDEAEACPGCREPVHIPLAVQEWIFDTVWEKARDRFDDLVPDETVIELARDRLRGGFETYGSQMFTWDAATRRRNVLEELADAIVYLVSGPIE
jgi:hypothetical protein